MVIEGEVARDVAMPFGTFDTAAHVEFVVFPNSDDGWSIFDDGREGIDTLGEAPGFGGIGAELFVKPIPVHDVKVSLVGPVLIEVFVDGCSVADAVDRVLVGAGTDFEPEIEEALGIVFGVDAVFLGGKSEEGSGEAVRVSLDEDLVMVSGVALESGELGEAGEVMSDLGGGRLAGLIEGVFGEAVFDDEFAFLGSSAPDEDGVGGGLSEHRPVGQADGIAVDLRRDGQREAEKENYCRPEHFAILNSLPKNALSFFRS